MTRTAVLLMGLVALGLAPVSAEAREPAATCGGRDATIVGTQGDDVLLGTPGPDVIAALGGKDRVRSGGGDDVVCGGSGDDLLDGMRGSDVLKGGPGRDQLVSVKGSDVLRGGRGTDRLEALSMRPSRAYGGSGADFLFLSIAEQSGYVVDGGPGTDIAELGRSSDDFPVTAVVIRRGPGTFSRNGVVTGRFLGIEQLGLDERTPYDYYGTDAVDLVSVGDGAQPFRAVTYGGDDDIASFEGDDYIDAGPGDDRVDAGPGTDTCVSAERARGCEVRS